jgi:hypothetical protein
VYALAGRALLFAVAQKVIKNAMIFFYTKKVSPEDDTLS